MNPRAVLAAFIVCIPLFWAGGPAVHGYHVGYNAATDHECMVRVVQWCR